MFRIGRTLPPAAAPIPLPVIIRAFFKSVLGRGPEVDNTFEEEIKQYFGVKYCFLLSSGKAALTIVLQALKEIYPGRDEVVIPAFTCYSVPAAVKRAGCKIRLCDLAPRSLDLDQEQLKEIVNNDKERNKILCVVPTHLFGCPADVAGIRSVVGADIPLLEDTAQAMGEKVNNSYLGTLGDVGFFSLGRGKALSTMEGGVIVTDNHDFARIIGRLCAPLPDFSLSDNFKFGIKAFLTTILQRPIFFWIPKALPFLRLGETLYKKDFTIKRISLFARELSFKWQQRLKQHQKARTENMAKLLRLDSFLCINDEKRGLIRLPFLVCGNGLRGQLCAESEKNGLGVMPAYPTPVNEIPELKEEFREQKYPVSKVMSEQLCTMPVHEFVVDSDQKRLINLKDSYCQRR